jgi:pyridoxamine 5'-phosphate oxidase
LIEPGALSAELIGDEDPFRLFQEWFLAARRSEPNDANAMALATTSPDGFPSVRMVLLKGHDNGGFVFYTNRNSRKGRDLAANPKVALLFHWKSLRRQVRIEGSVSSVDAGTADAYFASRARDSQLGAVASEQSTPLPARSILIDRFDQAKKEFASRNVKRPDHWTGFRVVPTAIEFWIDRPHRLHERCRFTSSGGSWTSSLLFP